MLRCGLLGEKLGHSYSPEIHKMLAGYEYRLYERRAEELESFIRGGEWDGLNVTMPYKKAVLPLCDELGERARLSGSVNTLVRRADGSIYGDNTDMFGFESLLRVNGIDPAGMKALVLGNGGACASVRAVLDSLGARTVVISRRGEDNYNNLERHRDAGIIVNTTPLGMYPNNGAQAVDLTMFPNCRAVLDAVLDIVYNPARTALLLQAEELGIKHAGGLHMLVAQAKRSSELFTGARIDDNEISHIERALMHRMMNIVLVGMPGCGKTTVAGMIGRMTGRPVQDVDTMIEQRAGITIPEIFARSGEEGFRKIETQIITEAGAQSGTAIATGGGSVTRQENYAPLHQNAVIVWLQRDIDKLPRDGRPLSARADLNEMYRRRAPMYSAFADMTADNNGTPEAAAEMILEALK